jgi:hypothetical protein
MSHMVSNVDRSIVDFSKVIIDAPASQWSRVHSPIQGWVCAPAGNGERPAMPNRATIARIDIALLLAISISPQPWTSSLSPY